MGKGKVSVSTFVSTKSVNTNTHLVDLRVYHSVFDLFVCQGGMVGTIKHEISVRMVALEETLWTELVDEGNRKL